MFKSAMSRLNVLIYSGDGTTPTTVLHATHTLRHLLTPYYAVAPITPAALISDPWSPSTALLVFPGGGDLGYCRMLNGKGNQKIREFLWRGGKILGFCAGAYYCTKRVEFDVGGIYRVVGDRELGIFKGIGRGPAFEGFAGGREEGARAIDIRAHSGEVFKCYYNGGGIFVNANAVDEVEILAEYVDQAQVDGGEAAAIYTTYGDGAVVLTHAHLEFSPSLLKREVVNPPPGYDELIAQLGKDTTTRLTFLKSCLEKLGLKVRKEVVEDVVPPKYEKIHFSSPDPAKVLDTVHSILEDVEATSHSPYKKLVAENATFLIEPPFNPTPSITFESTNLSHESVAAPQTPSFALPYHDPLTAPFHILPYTVPPPAHYTPMFNHPKFFSHLRYAFGNPILYSPILPSTNTLVDTNFKFQKHLPTGTCIVADSQTSGRGRGGNAWVTPEGCLTFSLILRHPMDSTASPVVLVQYVAALAIVHAIRTYSYGWDKLEVKIKWPNDVYALTADGPKKLSGILVTSSYQPEPPRFILTLGIGVNLTNAEPTTSVSSLVAQNPSISASSRVISRERFLAHLLDTFYTLYTSFASGGWDAVKDLYYLNWMHEGAVVKLEEEGGREVVVDGVDGETGCLVVRDRASGRTFEVRSDGNSFDFMKGLIRRKV